MSRSVNPRWRGQAAAIALLAGAALLSPTTRAGAITLCNDNEGVPLRLSDRPPGEDEGLFGAGSYTQTVVPITEHGGPVFDASGNAGLITDLDVALRIRHPRTQDLIVFLQNTVITNGVADIKTIPLIANQGCEDNEYNCGPAVNQDIAVHFDDAAPAFVDFACDYAVPTIAGRMVPSAAAFADFDNFLTTFTGRPLASSWDLIIIDTGTTGSSAALVEWCMIVNEDWEGDLAPRERTATISPDQSANGLPSISDWIESGLLLLGYNQFDERLFTAMGLDLDAPGVPANIERGSLTEYQRADTAPSTSGGDGRFTTADWVVTGLYANSVLAPVVSSEGMLSSTDRRVYLENTNIPRNVTVGIPVMMRSAGVEHEVGFGLQFDNSLLEFVRAERGPAVPSNAIFQLNNNSLLNTGLLGLQIGLLPDQTFPADGTYTCDDVLVAGTNDLLTGFRNTATGPSVFSAQLSTGVTFLSNDEIEISYIVGNNVQNFTIRDYQFATVYNFEKLQLLSTSDGSFGAAPSVVGGVPASELPAGTTYAILQGTNAASTFTVGTLARARFRVLPTATNPPSNGYSASAELPRVLVDRTAAGPIFNGSGLSPEAAQFFSSTLDNTETDPVTRPAKFSMTTTAGATSGCVADQNFDVVIRVDENLKTVGAASIGFRVDSSRFAITDVGRANDSLPAPAAGAIISNENSPFVEYYYTFQFGETSRFLNGDLLKISFTSLQNSATDTAIRMAVSSLSDVAANEIGVDYGSDTVFNCDGSLLAADDSGDNGDATAGTADAAGDASRHAQYDAYVQSRLVSVDSTGGATRLTVAADVSSLAAPLTSYDMALVFDSTSLDLESVGAGTFGVAPTADLATTVRDFDSYRLTATNPASTFTGGELLTATFLVTGISATPPSVHFSATPLNSDPLQLATLYFRGRPGQGAVATPLQFVENPLFGGKAVRNVAGVPIHGSFADASVTIIDNSDARSTIRVVDNVLASDSDGTVKIALDSVGIENAAGFAFRYNPDDIELLSAERGRDLPPDAFFYLNPNENDPTTANTAADPNRGLVKVLLGLQPGSAFSAGTRELVKLTFHSRATTDTAITPITFEPIYDNMEVVDPSGIPLVARFPDGVVRIAGDDCTYTVAPTASAQFPTFGGNGSFEVQTLSDCPWVAEPVEDWITITAGKSGNGTTTIEYAVAANTDTARAGSIQVGGQTYTVNQAGCSYEFQPDNSTFASEGGSGAFALVTDDTCSWVLESSATWVTITSPSIGTGTASVSFDVAENIGDTRTATITLTGAETITYTITQRRCSYEIAPTQSTTFEVAGGSGSFSISTDADCPWTAVRGGSSEFITLTGDTTGAGNGTINYLVASNSGTTREGTIVAGGRTYTVRQRGLEDCLYAFEPNRLSYPSCGGTGTITLSANAGCPLPTNAAGFTITYFPSTDTEEFVTIDSVSTATTADGRSTITIGYTLAENEDEARSAVLRIGTTDLALHEISQGAGNEVTAFDFVDATNNGNANGWTATAVPGFSAPTFGIGTTLPGGDLGHLAMTTPDNTNTFGFWSSPTVRLCDPAAAGNLFRVDFDVASSLSNRTSVPSFRFRTAPVITVGTSEVTDFSQSDIFVVESQGDGSLSPTTAGRSYTHLVTMPTGVDRFRMFFDVMNFGGADAASASIFLKDVVVSTVDIAADYDEAAASPMILGQDQSGWSTASAAPVFTAPQFSVNSRGLAIVSGFTGVGTPTETFFGLWNMANAVTLEGGKLYRVRWTLSARAGQSLEVRKSLVPAFRLRVNDSTFKAASYVNVESITDDSRIPTFLEKQTYETWFWAPAELNSNGLGLSFDYLLPAGTDNDPTIEVTLETVQISSFTEKPADR